MTCPIPSCARTDTAQRGLCPLHYQRWRDRGKPDLGTWDGQARGPNAVPPLDNQPKAGRSQSVAYWAEVAERVSDSAGPHSAAELVNALNTWRQLQRVPLPEVRL